MGNTQHKAEEEDDHKNTDCIVQQSLLDPAKEAVQPVLTPSALRRQRLEQLAAERPLPSARSFRLASDTWTKLSENRDGIATAVFIRMFESYPDLKFAFGHFRNLSNDDSQYHDVLRAHGVRVLGIVDQVLRMWPGQEEEMITTLQELGRKHIAFNAKVEYVDIVSQMFLFAIESALKESWDNNTEQAWGEIIRFITYVMRETMTL